MASATGRPAQCVVSLPAPEQWIVLDLAPDPESWCRERAGTHLGAEAEREWVEAFAGDLYWYCRAAQRERAISAGVLAPPGEPVLAFLYVRELRLPGDLASAAAVKREAERSEGPCFRPPEVCATDLPAGPAVRVHRIQPATPDSNTSYVLEGVTHYVLPPDSPGLAVEITMTWGNPGIGEVLCEVADEAAGSVRLL